MKLVDDMFYTNDPDNSIIKKVMSDYKQQLIKDAEYKQKIRQGLIPVNHTQVWHISDRD